MPDGSFSASVSAWVRETQQRLDAVFKESAQRVIETMQEPGPSKARKEKMISEGLGFKGRGANRKPIQGPVQMKFGSGNMPIDTGFLRASLQVSFDEPLPRREDAAPKEGQTYDAPEVSTMIAGATLGGHIYATYGAIYARRVNYGADGQGYLFVAKAAMKWPQIVEQVCADLQARVEI